MTCLETLNVHDFSCIAASISHSAMVRGYCTELGVGDWVSILSPVIDFLSDFEQFTYPFVAWVVPGLKWEGYLLHSRVVGLNYY